MRNKTLGGAAAVEAGLFVGVLGGYLIVIARSLRSISRLLAQVSAGVRAIERQTEPVESTLREITENLEHAATALEGTRG